LIILTLDSFFYELTNIACHIEYVKEMFAEGSVGWKEKELTLIRSREF